MQLLHEVTRHDADHGDRHARMLEWKERQSPGDAAVRDAVHAVMAPDAAAFRFPVEEVDDLFVTVLVGATMRAVDARRRGLTPAPPDPERLVDLILHGVTCPSPSPEGSA